MGLVCGFWDEVMKLRRMVFEAAREGLRQLEIVRWLEKVEDSMNSRWRFIGIVLF
jgi:hypothetical protein